MGKLKNILSLMLILAVFTGCGTKDGTNPDDNTGGTTPTTDGTDGGEAPIDPLSLQWSLIGPTTGSSGKCQGPYYAIASANVTSPYVLTVTSIGSAPIKFYSNAGCGNQTATISISADSNQTTTFWLQDTDTSKSNDTGIFTISKGTTPIVYSSVMFNNYDN